MTGLLTTCAALAVALLALTAPASAQSAEPDLAAIARKAESEKSTIPKAKKTYTNADLGDSGLAGAGESSALATGFMSESLGKPVSAEEMLRLSEQKVAAEEKHNRPDDYWLGQARAIRDQADKMVPRLAELQARRTNPNASLQQKADQEKAMLLGQIETLKKKWAALEAEARTAKANLALLSPPPRFQ